MTIFDIGDTAKITALFTDETGAPMAPASTTFTVIAPDHTQTPYTNGAPQVTTPVTGTVVLTLPVTAPAGRWWVRIAGVGDTGDPSQADTQTFYVRPLPA